jgi:signal transduction histidine kinase
LYDQAIESAHKHKFVQNEALANELVARFWLERGKEELAQVYLTKAHEGYQSWGAWRKVENLEEKYSHLLTRPTGVESRGGLDLDTVIKASQAISGEIDLDRLLEEMLGIMIENAGAQKGCLILEDGSELLVKAVGTVDAVCVNQAVVVESSADVSAAIVNYVHRTQENVVLGDAAQEGQFAADAYVLENRPKSVLCMPIVGRARLLGILYLENNLATNAFPPARVEVLGMLSAQAAISLENARLFDEMDRRVADATDELRMLLYSISHDLRAPLRGIDGFSQALLEDYAGQLDAEGQDYLQRVRKGSQRLGQYLDALLRYYREMRLEIQPNAIDLSALAQSIVEELQYTEPERQVEFVIAPGLTAQGDEVLLRRVLENLLGNAWKFTRDKDQARIELGCVERGGRRTYFVQDNGVGFDMNYARDKIFGVFQRLHPETEFEGTGVGLASVQRIIRRHGGEIEAEAQVGLGAKFSFTLGNGRGQSH